MKDKFHKLFSVLLSLVVLFSTFSFTVESHYCGDELVDVAIFSEAEGCGEDMDHEDIISGSSEEDSCCDSQGSMHCKDVLTKIEGASLDYFGFEKPELQKIFFVAAFFATYQNVFYESIKEPLVSQINLPPIFQRDRTVLFENFRI